MISTLTIFGATVLCLCLTVILVMRRLGSQALPVTEEWLSELSADRYRPMLRLLDEADFEFLRAQKGFRPAMEKRMRAQRIRVFRTYLQMLSGDFSRVCDGLKHVMVEAEYDRPELASALIQRQAAFAWGMMVVRCRLVLYSYGMAQVDVKTLVSMFEGMQVALTTMAECAVPAAS